MWGKLKNLVYETDEREVKETVQEVQEAQPEAAPTVVVGDITSEMVKEMYEKFILRLEDPETDCGVFHDFMEAVEKLEGVIPDESQRYKAAVATFKATAADIQASFPKTDLIMDQICAAFSQQIENEQNIGRDLETEAAGIESTIGSLEDQISNLQDQLADAQNELSETKTSIEDEVIRVNTLATAFGVVNKRVRDEYSIEYKRIETYLDLKGASSDGASTES